GEPRVERRGVPLAGQQIPPALDARGIGRAGFGWLPCHRSRPRQVITAPPLPAPSATSRVPVPSVSSHERRDMLSVSWDTTRLFRPVLAAPARGGGTIPLAARAPVWRMPGADLPRAAARRFNQVAWPAFAVLIVTGIWNVIAVRSQVTGGYETTLVVKLVVVL